MARQMFEVFKSKEGLDDAFEDEGEEGDDDNDFDDTSGDEDEW